MFSQNHYRVSALTKREAWSHSECLHVLTKYENATEEK